LTQRKRSKKVRIIIFNVDKVAMNARTTFKIKVFKVDNMCKTMHANNCDEIDILKV
jgi:hypothetical protein